MYRWCSLRHSDRINEGSAQIVLAARCLTHHQARSWCRLSYIVLPQLQESYPCVHDEKKSSLLVAGRRSHSFVQQGIGEIKKDHRYCSLFWYDCFLMCRIALKLYQESLAMSRKWHRQFITANYYRTVGRPRCAWVARVRVIVAELL